MLVMADADAGCGQTWKWAVEVDGQCRGMEANTQGSNSQQRHMTETQVSNSPILTTGDVTTNVQVGEGQCSHPIANMSSRMGVGLVGVKSQVDRVGCREDREGNS